MIVSKKIRTVKAPSHDIQPYISTKKGVPSQCQHSAELDLDIHNNHQLQLPGINLDFAYIVCRVCSFDIGDIIPGWSGFNSQMVANVPDTFQ